MNIETFLNPDLSLRLCLTLFQSIWQVPLLALIAWALDRVFLRPSVVRSYWLNTAAIIGSLILLPISFLMINVTDSESVSSRFNAESKTIDIEGRSSLNLDSDVASGQDPIAI